MLKLSPSKISTYLLCPFKYNCEINSQIRKTYKKDTPALIFGNLIHGCLNDYFKRTDPNKRSFETLRRLFETKFKANWSKHKLIFQTKVNIIKYIEESKKQFQYFIDSEFSQGELLLTEEFPKYFINPEIEIGGKFDRVDLDKNDLILIDYKTGKRNEDNDKDITFQLNFYEYLLIKLYPQYTVKKKILFFLKENIILTFEKPIILDEIEEKIIRIADTIKADNKFEPRLNALCKFCDYKSICSIFN